MPGQVVHKIRYPELLLNGFVSVLAFLSTVLPLGAIHYVRTHHFLKN